MLLKVVRFVNLVLSGMLTGNEFGGLIAIYPALGNLPPLARLRAEQEIYRRYGKIMPFYMSSTIASGLLVLVLDRDPKSSVFRFTLAGVMCFAGMLGVTLTRNVPINSRIVELPPEEASVEEFQELRRRWDRLHTIRNLLNIAGLGFTSLGALAAGKERR